MYILYMGLRVYLHSSKKILKMREKVTIIYN